MKKKGLVLIAVLFTTGLVVGQEFKFKGELEINPRSLVLSKYSKNINTDFIYRAYLPAKHLTLDVNTGLGFSTFDYTSFVGGANEKSYWIYKLGLGISYFTNPEKKGFYLGGGANYLGSYDITESQSNGSYIPYLNYGYRLNFNDKFFMNGGFET